MNLTSALVPLPVLLPLVAAGLTLVAGPRDRWQRAVSITALTAVLIDSFALLVLADRQGALVVQVGGWAPPIGIPLVVDRLAALMLVISSIVILGVLLFAVGQGRSGDDERDGGAPLPIFHPTLMVLAAGVSTTFISGDLFHIYVGFEMLLVASFVLLTLGGSKERVTAGVNYVFVNLLSSLLFLSALALIYASTGTVTLAQLAGRLDQIPEGVRTTLQLTLLLGFAIKAAIFPMSGWLPDSYPTAPAPVTAVFAGLLTKVGVYAIIRTQTLLFPDGRLNTMLLWAALLTMIVGILGAIAQDDMKRLLSFTLVSHIGYLVFGIAIANKAALSGAIFYVAHHIIIQTTLFLIAGLIEWRSGTTSLAELGGLARTAPVIAVLFFIPALNLAGIPPFSGFLGKVGLIQGGVQDASPLAYLLVAGAAVTSLLTLYAMARVWARAFWQRSVTDLTEKDAATAGPPTARPGGTGSTASTQLLQIDPQRLATLQAMADRPVPRGMMMPAAGLVIVSVALTLLAGPLFGVTDRAATDLLARQPYIEAVFPGGVP